MSSNFCSKAVAAAIQHCAALYEPLPSRVAIPPVVSVQRLQARREGTRTIACESRDTNSTAGCIEPQKISAVATQRGLKIPGAWRRTCCAVCF